MLHVTRTLAAISCVACLLMSGAVALAQDDQNKNSQQSNDQQAAQQKQASDSQQNATTNTSQSADEQSNQENAQSEQQKQQTDEGQQSGKQDQTIRTKASTDEKSDIPQPGDNSQRSKMKYNSPGAPWGWNSPRNSQARGEQSRGENSRGQQGSLGVNITNSGDGEGVTIMRVRPGTPADQMGLRSRDRITTLNGKPVRSVDEFISDIRNISPGQEVELGTVRNGNERTIRGELEGYSEEIVEVQGSEGSRGYRRFESVIQPEGSDSNRFGRDESMESRRGWTGFEERPIDRNVRSSDRENRQTSYEDRGDWDRSRSGDVEGRLSRVEQQLDRISQNIEELRNLIGPGRLRDETSTGQADRSRARDQNQRDNRPTQPNGQLMKKNDRWNNENRFEQGDLQGSRDRGAQEAARRRAEQTGSRLQQEERQRAANSQQNPGQPATNPADQSPNNQ
jgi:hypothetical protein